MNRSLYMSTYVRPSYIGIGTILRHIKTGTRYEVIRFEQAVSMKNGGEIIYEGETVCIFPVNVDEDYRKRCTPYKPWRKDVDVKYEVVNE
jgi:hypothetical protein